MTQNVQQTRRDWQGTGAGNNATRNVRTGWWQAAWLVPVAVLLLAMVVLFAPPYLTFDPAKQGSPINPALPGLDYGLLVGHVLFGSVALITVLLSVWPWLRVRFPVVHRWSGRVYVFAALPASLLTLGVNYLHNGWHANVGAYVQGVTWFATTLIGFVAIRRGNLVRHRRWMLYSFAMAASVVWGPLAQPVLSSPGEFGYMIEFTRWAGWLLNLLIIKWWLDRGDRRGVVVRFPAK